MTDPETPRPTPNNIANDKDAAATGTAVAQTRGEEDELIARWLRPDPDEPWPAAWRITEKGPQMWALAGYLEEALDPDPASPADQAWFLMMASQDFALPREAVSAALVFYHRHREAVDAVAETNRPPIAAGELGATQANRRSGPATV